MTTNAQVPQALRNWFVVHFIADIIFAIPLFFFPESFLGFMGWKTIDPITTPAVAAALFGIGIESLLSRNATADSFKTMLSLKVIWSLSAVIGLSIALIKGLYTNNIVGFSLLGTFVGFNILWSYWLIRLRKSEIKSHIL